ncbi:hypothetical protein MKK63_24770 [Methylobacterium sp. J-088]|uniref:hypothetical protein n=1 Tax=Methylobacterium sp. J-088 TaxID=2836664 RepID=UPI001FB95ACB|nr:hypothetical protein [Methylobacterium sp. J-088]MCJ2065895.1 hypothetical protein [Methylobacterium sp. J-088]
MSRRRAAQRPRGGAEARPDAGADNRAASRVDPHTTTGPDQAHCAAADALTDAEVLVGSTTWLLSLADWLAEELDLADGETVRLRRADVERMRAGLTRCVACLDTLTCDPAQLPPLDDASSEVVPSPTTPSPRTLQ